MATPKEDSASYYYFDDVSVDRVDFRVLKGDQLRTLEPRAFDLLTYLIANRGRVVEKQELFEQIWKQAFVTDNALTRAIKEIRRVIGDDASSPRYIETIPKRGYRFIAEVRTSKETTDETEEIIPRRPEEIVNALNYKVRGKLGQGGGGVVFLAEDTRLGRTVVLKFLSEELVADEVARRRFLREARLASSLDHPNICTIYEINEISGLHFIVMQYVEGATLKQFIAGRPLDTDTALAIAVQMADAIRAAHEQGIIHRDVKPGNIIITKKGQVKILDFGLAKSVTRAAGGGRDDVTDLTRQGAQLGTPAYMSPEQARGEAVDHRSDIFSFGVVLYEMLTGQSPFKGKNKTPIDVMHSVVYERPRSASEINAQVSDELRAIIERAMEKEPARRYQTAAELLDELIKLKQDSLSSIQSVVARKASWGRRPLLVVASRPVSRRVALASTAALIVIAVATWFYLRSANLRWAKQQIPRIEEMAKAQNYFDAYNLALNVQEYLPDDADVARLMPVISDSLTVTTEPAGAKVYLKRFRVGESGKSLPRELIGDTPINNQRIARGEYILYIEKEGFAPVERTISNTLLQAGTTLQPPSYTLSRWVNEIIPVEEPSVITRRLIEAEKIPQLMVFIPGGDYRLISWGKPTEAIVHLGDYLMDRQEVSNREYKDFINAGGYLKRQYWKHPFIKDGRELSWEEAMREFVDRTGLRGPRSWSGQSFPVGKDNHPVTDITWYEAAAFAEFKGKRLPTIFEWEKAARDGIFSHYSALIMPWGPVEAGGSVEHRANFKSGGAAAVDSFEFGMSPYGCYNMAGNVSEWCLNETTEGFITAGGSWDDLSYIFGNLGALPGFHYSNRVGFRCAMRLAGAEGDQGMMRIDTTAQAPTYMPTSEAAFNGWLTHYQYDKSPLDSQVVEVQETAEWRREKIIYRGAKDERAIAYLYLPKNAEKPFQVIQFVPAADVYGGYITIAESVEMMVAPFIKSGRAVFAVVFKGFKEREWPQDQVSSGPSSVKRREIIVNRATDLRRGLDYLETREDIDTSRIAYYGFSAGAEDGIMFTAVEGRYRSVVLVAAGLPRDCVQYIAEANPANFAPHIRVPKLMLNGRYDEGYLFKTEIEPLYKLLRDPKKIVTYESSHCPPLETFVPVVNGWLDETLGPVRSN